VTPLISSWLTSMVIDGKTVTLQTTSGRKLRYTDVPEHLVRAIQVANSPGKIWRESLRGKYGEAQVK